MNILETLLENHGSAVMQQLAARFGVDQSQARSVLGQLVPALSRGMQNNIASPQGLENLLGALGRNNHQQYLDQPGLLAGDQATTEGNAILGHLLGNREASRQVAQRAAGNTGLDAGLLKKMLPVVATMVMGTVSKQVTSSGLNPGAGGGAAGGLLTQFLDADRDGSVIDDLLGMAGRLL